MSTTYFWFRRDLRLSDNVGLKNALEASKSVQCIFIFDEHILNELAIDDARVQFIHEELTKLQSELNQFGSSLRIEKGVPSDVWRKIISEENISAIYTNKDYEPYARKRDGEVRDIAEEKNVRFERFKDQVIFEEGEITKDDGLPYTVYTPFKNKWLATFKPAEHMPYSIDGLTDNFKPSAYTFPSLSAIGFEPTVIKVQPFTLDTVANYDKTRDFPATDGTSYLSPHLRFGTIGIRALVHKTRTVNAVFLSELIWREFFMQILYHFPKVVHQSFRIKYDRIEWRNDPAEFKAWCDGKTGYPMVDAGMRQLNETGYMHNRVRMVVASFLCKHLLIDWRWGEAYFAQKLLDYDLSANNGNWQWAAGTGCDAAPYFRVFNPEAQLKKFDPKGIYIRKWVKDLDELTYPKPIVEHAFARLRALEVYKKGLEESGAL